MFYFVETYHHKAMYKLICNNPECQSPMLATYLHTGAMYNIWHWHTYIL